MVYGLLTTFAYGIHSDTTDTIKIQQTSSTSLASLVEIAAGNEHICI